MLAVVDLHSGVLGHAAAARLARAGWRVEDAAVADDGSLDVGVLVAVSSPPASRCPEAVRLEVLAVACQGRPEKRVSWQDGAVAQWCKVSYVDFLELFDGTQGLSASVARLGLRVGFGIDRARGSYGCSWDLSRQL